jgi:hypothetical protein
MKKAVVPKSKPKSVSRYSKDGDFFFTITSEIHQLAVHVHSAFCAVYSGSSSAVGRQKAKWVAVEFPDQAYTERMVGLISAYYEQKKSLAPLTVEEAAFRRLEGKHLQTMRDNKEIQDMTGFFGAYDRRFSTDDRIEFQNALGAQAVIAVQPQGRLIMMHLGDYLPADFAELVETLSESKLHYHSMTSIHAALSSLFRETFHGMQVTRSFCPIPKVTDAHEELEKLLSLINAAKQGTRPVLIEVDTVDDGGLTVRLDGVVFNNRGTIMRTLAALALLSEKEQFIVDEFCELYFGETSGESHKRFNKCMSQLKEYGISAIPRGKGSRKIEGSVFRVSAEPEKLKEWLKGAR